MYKKLRNISKGVDVTDNNTVKAICIIQIKPQSVPWINS